MTKNDYAKIAEELFKNKSVLFPFDLDDSATCHNIFMCSKFKTLERTTFGGQPSGIIVGIMFKSYFYFDANKEHYEDYVSEKLRIPNADSIYITEMINSIFSKLKILNEENKNG